MGFDRWINASKTCFFDAQLPPTNPPPYVFFVDFNLREVEFLLENPWVSMTNLTLSTPSNPGLQNPPEVYEDAWNPCDNVLKIS